MIPKNITRDHVLRAIKEIDKNGVPSQHRSRKYSLLYEGKKYPPKYVIRIANLFANGKELDSELFNGGYETNNFLKRMNFLIVGEGSPKQQTVINQKGRKVILRKNSTVKKPLRVGGSADSLPLDKPRKKATWNHTERCPECKDAVFRMLQKIYGKVSKNHKIPTAPTLEAFRNHPFYPVLKDILHKLQIHRGHKNFIKSTRLPACDYFVHEPGFIVEFDESQHFTIPRAITLENYPAEMKVGFSVTNWLDRCRKLRKKDNDPPDRDETRAWYDTLRDFVPALMGYKPTVRLCASERRWCKLDPENSNDVKTFHQIIEKYHIPSGIRVVTVLLSSYRRYDNNTRLETLSKVVREVGKKLKGETVVLFPGGWFSAGSNRADTIYNWVEDHVSDTLRENGQDIVVCVGIDGRETSEWPKDQIVAAINKEGFVAMGRKFSPAPSEKNYVELARNWLREHGHERMFKVGNKVYFLCACYDSFGLKKRGKPSGEVDVVLDLVHGFYPHGQGGSGEVYFAKHGFAGASKNWKCPVFGAAVFFNRDIPRRWPSGVYWTRGDMSTQKWRYEDNPLKAKSEFLLAIDEGSALIRLFDI